MFDSLSDRLGSVFDRLRGRGALTEADAAPGAPPAIVIGHDIWQSRFDGDRSSVGLEVELDREKLARGLKRTPAFQIQRALLATQFRRAHFLVARVTTHPRQLRPDAVAGHVESIGQRPAGSNPSDIPANPRLRADSMSAS